MLKNENDTICYLTSGTKKPERRHILSDSCWIGLNTDKSTDSPSNRDVVVNKPAELVTRFTCSTQNKILL